MTGIDDAGYIANRSGPISVMQSLHLDACWERFARARRSQAEALKPFIQYFLRHPGSPNAMDLADYRREHPEFPCRNLSHLKGRRTLLRRKGLL